MNPELASRIMTSCPLCTADTVYIREFTELNTLLLLLGIAFIVACFGVFLPWKRRWQVLASALVALFVLEVIQSIPINAYALSCPPCPQVVYTWSNINSILRHYSPMLLVGVTTLFVVGLGYCRDAMRQKKR